LVDEAKGAWILGLVGWQRRDYHGRAGSQLHYPGRYRVGYRDGHDF
jgi:hypothetical protein